MVPEGQTLLRGCWCLGLGEQVGARAPGWGVRRVQQHVVACRGGHGLSRRAPGCRRGSAPGRLPPGLSPLRSPGLGHVLPWPVVWSYPGPRLLARCQWASVRWPVCQPHVSLSKLQETSGGGHGGVSTPCPCPSPVLRGWGRLVSRNGGSQGFLGSGWEALGGVYKQVRKDLHLP